jgi:hypothetical protein
VSGRHILNLADEGAFGNLDMKGVASTKRTLRMPIESYRNFILSRMSGPTQQHFLRTLPKAALRDLHREIGEWLRAAT